MNRLGTNELRELYRQFFEGKEHVWIASAPLVPEHDPSVLFTTAGMHPLVPYLQGRPHPQGKRLVNVQKCLRTTDIDEVGDATHATVFEMLGNWSLGDYFKEKAIAYSWEFLTDQKWLDIEPKFLAVSVFGGNSSSSNATKAAAIPADTESAKLWLAVGIPKERIAYLGMKENWWPAGGGAVGPQGPDTEIFYWTGDKAPPRLFDPTDNRWVEIWNNVFMQYNRTPEGILENLQQQNVDTGMGLDRVVMTLNGLDSIYDVDTYRQLMANIKTASQQQDMRQQRILADHIKAASFVLCDEHPVTPSNTDRGYVLRRIIRRAVRSAHVLSIDPMTIMARGLEEMVMQFGTVYPSLVEHQVSARNELAREVERFESALAKGLREFDKLRVDHALGDVIAGAAAFNLASTYGFPIELTQELAGEHNLTVDMGGYAKALKQHQGKSREAIKGKFAGGLGDHSVMSIKYHTATHLLHQALREVLGDHVLQRGSNITGERLRFDFSHPQKLTDDQRQQVENLVNEKIAQDLPVEQATMTVVEAKKKGALGLFEAKYGEQVSVYAIGNFSLEICGGPHVPSTGELGVFEITKEESVSAGIRRIKAVLSHHPKIT